VVPVRRQRNSQARTRSLPSNPTAGPISWRNAGAYRAVGLRPFNASRRISRACPLLASRLCRPPLPPPRPKPRAPPRLPQSQEGAPAAPAQPSATAAPPATAAAPSSPQAPKPGTAAAQSAPQPAPQSEPKAAAKASEKPGAPTHSATTQSPASSAAQAKAKASAAAEEPNSSAPAKQPAAALAPETSPTIIGIIPPRKKLMVFRSCRKDLDAYCAGVEYGDGRQLRCLESNKASLSPDCQGALAKLAQ